MYMPQQHMIFAVGAALQEDSNGISRPCPLAHMYVDDVSNLHHINSLYTIITIRLQRGSLKGHYIYYMKWTDLYIYSICSDDVRACRRVVNDVASSMQIQPFAEFTEWLVTR